ncbi:hypothetical protein EG328_009815 [Venturia inaequalis]|uniref:Uncharacterized protein n=1 Tax=Venturia inaequalis TaxID=5025 RepID=A0A8H3YV06_VENIN|nr:hypothetical protein EG328_009815 [Venturia inaequalis]KAE9974604.1 hypothetical protein EG327_008727 [Venturia inaequalis]
MALEGPAKKRKAASSRTSSKRQKKSPVSAPSIPSHPSFLGLPPELRLLILGYLLPDVSTIPTRCDADEKLHPNLRGKDGTGQSAAEFDKFLEDCEDWEGWEDDTYVPLRQDLERSYTDIMRISRLISNEGKALLYRGKSFDAFINEKDLTICDQKYMPPWMIPPWMIGTAARRCNALHINPDDLVILARNIEALTLYLYFEHGESQLEKSELEERDWEELRSLTRILANALAACGSLKQLTVVVRIIHSNAVKLVRTSKDDEDGLEGILVPFSILRNLEGAEVIVEDTMYDSSTVPVSPVFERFRTGLKNELLSNKAVSDKPSLTEPVLE